MHHWSINGIFINCIEKSWLILVTHITYITKCSATQVKYFFIFFFIHVFLRTSILFCKFYMLHNRISIHTNLWHSCVQTFRCFIWPWKILFYFFYFFYCFYENSDMLWHKPLNLAKFLVTDRWSLWEPRAWRGLNEGGSDGGAGGEWGTEALSRSVHLWECSLLWIFLPSIEFRVPCKFTHFLVLVIIESSAKFKQAVF